MLGNAKPRSCILEKSTESTDRAIPESIFHLYLFKCSLQIVRFKIGRQQGQKQVRKQFRGQLLV